ncbi:MAG: hypothetical protein JW749_10785 [Sedimentisphaerales bacterium]|nr:hypothetical protein [Sedimentisphaerales bacterium]
MPIDRKDLQNTLIEMKRLYESDPKKAVRSQEMIKLLHDFSVQELKRLGISEKEVTIRTEARIFGSHKPKEVDVAVIHPQAGPLIVISLRSQMSSIEKNFANYYEGIIGDVISLHGKYPDLVIGQIYLLPKRTIIKDKNGHTRKESHDLEKKEPLFLRIANRKNGTDRMDKYEHVAFLAVDFLKNPPEVLDIPKDPILRIEDFYDKLLATYQERNPFLDILE